MPVAKKTLELVRVDAVAIDTKTGATALIATCDGIKS